MGLALAEPDEEDRRIEGDNGARVWVQPGVDKWYPGATLDFDGGFYFRHPDYEPC